MKLIDKLIALALCICALTGLLAGCAGPDEKKEEPLSIYASFYPIYALAELIAADVPDLHLNCLVQPQDGCLRNYELSDWDLALLAQADAVIAGGRGLEGFEAILYALGDDGPAVASVLYNMELETRESVNAGEESHWADPNPHIYMRIDGAIEIAERIAANLSLLYPQHGDQFAQNLDDAENRLRSLQEEMHDLVGDLRGSKVIVMNEALLYTAGEFELEAELCFDRESGEGFYDQELEDCISLLQGCEARVVLIEKQAPQALCAALEAVGYRVARMDVLSTRRADEGAEGYFEAQRANARALADAFAAEEVAKAE